MLHIADLSVDQNLGNVTINWHGGAVIAGLIGLAEPRLLDCSVGLRDPMINVLPRGVPWARVSRKYRTANVSVTELQLMVPINGALLTESVSAGALRPALRVPWEIYI